jgi:hypothetical protein
MQSLPTMFLSGVLLLSFFLPTQNSTSETESKAAVAEPKYMYNFVAIDEKGELIGLEREDISFHSKARVLPGYASVKMTALIKASKSSVRLTRDSKFVVSGRSQMDPASSFRLRMLKATKNEREFLLTTGHGSVFGGSATSTLSAGDVPIRFEEYGTHSYRITPEHPLQPGEYALAFGGMPSQIFCFGVD